MNGVVSQCIVCTISEVTRITRNGLSLFLCTKCNLAWRDTFDVQDGFYEEENEVSLKDENLTRRQRNVQDRIRLIRKYFSPNDLCDVGAGEGMFIKELTKQGYTNVLGIEPNTRAVSFAKEKGIDVQEGTLDHVPEIIVKRKIHAVTLFHVIEHLDDPFGALKKIYGSLNDGDHLVIETPNASAYALLKTKYIHPLIYPEHLYYFDAHNLPLLLEKVGFTVVAKGKRGFDQYNLSIRQSLFYLGIGKSPYVKKESIGSESIAYEEKKQKSNPIRALIRKTLSLIVVFLGRVDYQWVIVKK